MLTVSEKQGTRNRIAIYFHNDDPIQNTRRGKFDYTWREQANS